MLKNKVEELVDKYLDEVISIRRYLHQNPELSLKEFNTAEFIVKELNKIGLDAQRGRENNGVVSNLNLGKGKKTLMLRADMDALPIQEETNFEFKSKNPGVMHACGHDVHTSILLGVSKVLNEIKDEINGNVKFVDTSDFKSWVKNLENISEGDKSDVLTELKNHVSDMATEIKKEDVAGEMQYLYAILLKIN